MLHPTTRCLRRHSCLWRHTCLQTICIPIELLVVGMSIRPHCVWSHIMMIIFNSINSHFIDFLVLVIHVMFILYILILISWSFFFLYRTQWIMNMIMKVWHALSMRCSQPISCVLIFSLRSAIRLIFRECIFISLFSSCICWNII